MSNTSHLNLIKPGANTVGWGGAINDNFDKIDSSYASLVNQIGLLRTQMGQLGLYYSDPQYENDLVIVVSGSSATDAHITLKGTQNTIQLYNGSDYVNLSHLLDYSMFIVKLIKADGQSFNDEVTINGVAWRNNDLAVKVTRYDAASKENHAELLRMMQTIGGYYEPTRYTTDEGRILLQYARKNAMETAESHSGPSLFLYPTSVNENVVSFAYGAYDPMKQSYETLQDSTFSLAYPQIRTKGLQKTFTKTNANTNSYTATLNLTSGQCFISGVRNTINGQAIFIDYKITEDANKNLQIVYDTTNLPVGATVTYYVNYAVEE